MATQEFSGYLSYVSVEFRRTDDRVYREYWDRYPVHFVETPPLLSFGGLFHVEHERDEPRRFASLVFFFVIDRRYLPNFTSRTFTSAGETPGIREAWPIVVGRMRVSFCRASIVSDCIE